MIVYSNDCKIVRYRNFMITRFHVKRYHVGVVVISATALKEIAEKCCDNAEFVLHRRFQSRIFFLQTHEKRMIVLTDGPTDQSTEVRTR